MQFPASLRLTAFPAPVQFPAFQTVALWRGRLRRREALASLARLGPHILDDVGLTVEQVEAELKKPFWKA
jgi:uncharacterized protein YjiS (DUF1127 family)